MTPTRTPRLRAYLATTIRILRQLAGDHRSVAMIVAVPTLIITLMYFMFEGLPHRPGTPAPFNNACLIMLGVFPLIVMFLITSITMQRERVSGTLERILTTPLHRFDLLAAMERHSPSPPRYKRRSPVWSRSGCWVSRPRAVPRWCS